MDSYVFQLVIIGALVVVNALFAGSELALISLRDSRLHHLEQRGRRGRTLARLARDPNRFLATIQIGITLAGFLASATAAIVLAEPLVGLLGFLGGAAETVAIVSVTMVLAFVTLVFGELAPKRLAMQSAERWALLVARPLNLLSTLVRPVVWLLGRATDLTVRAFGGDPGAQRDSIAEEELRDLIASQQGFTAEQRTIFSGAFAIADRTLRQIIVPRRDVVFVTTDTPRARTREILVSSGHSRAPVTQGPELDDVVGVVHLRDLLEDEGATGQHVEPALLLPDTLLVSRALRRMKDERRHLAVVVDERGTVDGIVTLGDIIEEIVGEIFDEADDVIHEPGQVLLLPGTFPLHDLPDLGVDVRVKPSGHYTTIAGLILARLGHIPDRPGETVRLEDWTAEVTAIEGRAITQVRLRPAPSPARDT